MNNKNTGRAGFGDLEKNYPTPTLKDYEAMVKRPGKFEGEPAYTPYFYDFFMDGEGEDVSKENDSTILRFTIEVEDVEMFPELQEFTHVELIFSETGFVYGHTCIIK